MTTTATMSPSSTYSSLMRGDQLLAHRNAALSDRDEVAVAEVDEAPGPARKVVCRRRLTDGCDLAGVHIDDLPGRAMQFHQRDAADESNGDTREETPKPKCPHSPSPGRQGFRP